MNVIQWVIKRKTFESVKQLSFHNIINYICSMWNKQFPPKHIKEQAEWRMQQIKIKSPECFNKKECFCGCDINYTVFQPDACQEKNKCFPELISKTEWNEFKEKGIFFYGWTEKSIKALDKKYWKSLSEKKKQKFSMTGEEWSELKNSIVIKNK